MNPLRALIDYAKGNIRFQGIYERLCHSLFLAMHCGPGGSVKTSGEQHSLNYVASRLREQNAHEIVAFDVGANVGETVQLLLECLPTPLKIFAFEPSAVTFPILTQTIRELGGTVEAVLAGLGRNSEDMILYSGSDDGSKIASFYSSTMDRWSVDNPREEKVTVLTLDDFCAARNINVIDFIKIDTEGHDLAVLEGGKRLLADRAIRFIQFEFGPANLGSRTYMKDFFRLLAPTHTIHRIVKNGLHPMPIYRDQYEIFYLANYLAELK